MKLNKVVPLSLAAALSLSACNEDKSVNETRTKVEASVQPTSSAVSSSAPSASTAPKAEEHCPSEMVKVPGVACVDRYEASLYGMENGLRASRFYYPHHRILTERFKFYTEGSKALDAGPPAYKIKMDVPKPPDWQLAGNFEVKALPIKGQEPSTYVSAIAAEKACGNEGKRLCTKEEWVTACKGENNTKFPYGNEYKTGVCNISQQGWAPLLLHGKTAAYIDDPNLVRLPLKNSYIGITGSWPECVSKWGDDGIYDMVGNVQEWIDDPDGTFLGGFVNLPSEEGCDEEQTGHKRPYYDYSLGLRCCTDLFQEPQPVKDLPKAAPGQKPKTVPARPRWPIVCHPKEMGLPGINMVSRESWGAKPPENDVLGAMPNCDNLPIEYLVLHHTGEAKPTGADREVWSIRNAQAANMVKWGDIAYHLAIGPSGKIYELRNMAFRGDSHGQYYPGKNRSHTPEHHLLVTLIGNYQKQELTEEAGNSVEAVIAAARQKFGDIPVLTHKSVAYTGCPGKNAIEWFNNWTAHPTSVPRQLPPDSPSPQLLSPDGSGDPHSPLPQKRP